MYTYDLHIIYSYNNNGFSLNREVSLITEYYSFRSGGKVDIYAFTLAATHSREQGRRNLRGSGGPGSPLKTIEGGGDQSSPKEGHLLSENIGNLGSPSAIYK